jgi:hypothetical protein
VSILAWSGPRGSTFSANSPCAIGRTTLRELAGFFAFFFIAGLTWFPYRLPLIFSGSGRQGWSRRHKK